ncbi:MAG: hypothetical protein KDD04_03260, partial [Sinomicrobium sp.]|nr:hypothetical protein [Sinomicrobium sp.]
GLAGTPGFLASTPHILLVWILCLPAREATAEQAGFGAFVAGFKGPFRQSEDRCPSSTNIKLFRYAKFIQI